jgi:hypothetical protein
MGYKIGTRFSGFLNGGINGDLMGIESEFHGI